MSTPLRVSPAFDEPKVDSPLSESDDDQYFQWTTEWVRNICPPLPNIAYYPVDSDVEDISIKDSKGTTVAVIVQSKIRRLAAEKTRAAFVSLAVLDDHNVHDDGVD